MLVFVDTEFTSLDENAQLLSIGLVAESNAGIHLYREIGGTSIEGCDDFVVTNVAPRLSGGKAAKAFPTVGLEVWHWLKSLAMNQAVQLACDWSGDWAWTMLLLDAAHQHGAPTPMPPNMIGPPHLIWETIGSDEALAYSKAWRSQHHHHEHHALHDAANNRATYLRFARTPAAPTGEPYV